MKSKIKKITAIMLCVMMLFSILPAPLFAAEGEETSDSEIKVEEITVISESDSVKVGETLVFSASVLPEDASDKSVTWTVTQTTENATISEEGVLTAVSAGEVTVKATANDGSDVYGEKTVSITERPIAVSEITVASEEDIVLIGESLQMSASVSPDNAMDKSVTWSVTNGTGSAAISADGILTGEEAGEVTVKATANDGSGIYGEKVITIKARVNVEKINLTASSRYVGTYKDITIIKNIYPSNATNTDLTWTSSDTTIATVGDTGIVTTKGKSGTVTITAKAADGSNVKGSIQLEVGKNIIVAGETSTFSARVDYENVVWDIENPEIVEKVSTSYNYMSWLSSKPYNQGIKLRGLQSGSSKVTMKTSSGTELASTTVYVYTPVSSIASDTKNIKFEVGDTYDLDIKISPENVDSEFSDIYYSSTDDTVASVDSTGKVTAKELGSARIVVTSKYNNKKCAIPVEVVKFAADIQLSESETKLTSENNVFQLEYILEPADATDKSATFKSSDESVAIVNKDGKIFAVGNGSAVITVTSGDGKQSKEFFVTVDNVVSMTGINIKDESIVVTTEGKIPEYQTQYELLPNDAANTGLIWEIANEDIATVDQTGKVTAVAEGTTTLTVKTADGRYSDNCDINVIKGYNKVTYLRVREYDSTSSSSNIIGHATAYYGEDFPVREDLVKSGYDFEGMYYWFDNGVYSRKIDKDYVIKGNGSNLDLYIKESKRYVKDIELSDEYYVRGESFSVYLYTETENVCKDLITATSTNTNVLMPHPYSNDVFENGKVRMVFDIKGTGKTTITFKNSNNSIIVNKTITIVYVNAEYKVLDEKIAAPEITSLTYNPGRVTKPTINYNINDPTKKICIKYKSNDMNFWVDFGEDYATGSLISEDQWNALYPGHTYQFRAYLYDPNNKYTSTAYGSIFTCKYEAPAPTFSIENPGYNYNVVKISGNRSDYDNIYVYRSVYSNKGFKRVGTISSEETEFKDKSLTTGKTYYYKVIGDVKVNYAKSLTSSVKGKKVLPSKVSGVKLTPSGSTKVKVSWGKVSGASGYQIYRATSLNGKYSKVTTIKKGSTVSYTNSKLSSNKTYYYKVRAYRTVKKKTYYGSYSDVMTVRTAPGAPKISTSSGGYDGVKINVKSVSGASGYDIYRATSKKGKYAKVATVNSAVVYTDKGLSSNKTYYYKVRAYNSNGVYGSYSSVVSRKTSVKPPDKVVGVSFTPSGSTSVKVKWEKVSGASGYQIYRATSLNGKYSKVATIKKGSTVNYTNSKLSSNATYYYKIRAYKTVKKKTYYGSYSDVMTVEMSSLSQN